MVGVNKQGARGETGVASRRIVAYVSGYRMGMSIAEAPAMCSAGEKCARHENRTRAAA